MPIPDLNFSQWFALYTFGLLHVFGAGVIGYLLRDNKQLRRELRQNMLALKDMVVLQRRLMLPSRISSASLPWDSVTLLDPSSDTGKSD